MEEYENGTDPTLSDTDGDGASDGNEVSAGTDPLEPLSFPPSTSTAVPGLHHIASIFVFMMLLIIGIKANRRKSMISVQAIIFSLAFSFFHATSYAEIKNAPWIYPEPRLISPEEAKAYYEGLEESKTQELPIIQADSVTITSPTTATPEIVELARALQHDPLLIYEYVKNHVEYTPYFGSLKGATLTYIEGSGNDFDQASLMIALLRQSGYSAQYVYGYMDIPYTATDDMDLENWLRVDPNLDAVWQVFSRGQIPASYFTSGWGWRVDRVWVQATINSTTCRFDPAFKIHSQTTGIDVASAMGYSRSAFLSAAGGTTGTNYVQNLSQTNIETTLNNYTMNLVNNIRNNHPNKGLEEIIGGSKIIPEEISQLPTSLHFSSTPEYYWTSISTSYRHTMQITHGQINKLLYLDCLGGQKISVTYQNGMAQLWLDEEIVAYESQQTTSDQLTLNIDHKYVDGPPDQEWDYHIERGCAAVIFYNFSSANDNGSLLKRRVQQMQTYRMSGYSDTSDEVVTETLNVIGMNWENESLQYNLILQALTDSYIISHHRMGLVQQSSSYHISIAHEGWYPISRTNDEGIRQAFVKAYNTFASAMEHSVFEQDQFLTPSVSTVKALWLNNSNGAKTYKVTSANYSSIVPPLNYSSATKQKMLDSVNNGGTLIVPQNGQLSHADWTGYGYADFIWGETWAGAMYISGGYNGGASAYDSPLNIPVYNNMIANSNYQSITTQNIYSNDPVDMTSGHFVYQNTDISLSGAKSGLSFERQYNSGNNTTDGPLGYGWTHNYNVYATIHSNTDFGSGDQNPMNAATAIATAVVSFDLMNANPDVINLKNWMVSLLANKWGTDRLLYTKICVHSGTDVSTYVRLPDDTYTRPPGVTGQLVWDGSNFRIDERFDRTIHFNTDLKISSITDADGNEITFTYTDGKLQTVEDEFGHSLDFSYSGDRISYVTDPQSRNVEFYYSGNNLIRYVDAGNYSWRYGYDSEHRITTLQDPYYVTTVTNVYDSLDRVKTQTVPRQTGTAVYDLFFSGYRNIEEDADENQTIYHFDRKKRLVALEDALGNQTTYTYDGQNQMLSKTDPNGNTWTYQYDGNNNLRYITNPDGQTTEKEYDSSFRLTDVTDPLGNTVHYDYDSEHHLTKTTVWPESGSPIETTKTYYTPIFTAGQNDIVSPQFLHDPIHFYRPNPPSISK